MTRLNVTGFTKTVHVGTRNEIQFITDLWPGLMWPGAQLFWKFLAQGSQLATGVASHSTIIQLGQLEQCG